jgi:hypothetical protein
VWQLGGVPQRHRTDRMSLAVNNGSDLKEFTVYSDNYFSGLTTIRIPG